MGAAPVNVDLGASAPGFGWVGALPRSEPMLKALLTFEESAVFAWLGVEARKDGFDTKDAFA